MRRNKGGLLLLLCGVVGFTCAEVFDDVLKQVDACNGRCKVAPFPLPDKIPDPEGAYATKCCRRGCRFFNLVDLQFRQMGISNLNNSLEACDDSCMEGYTLLQDEIACKMGCAFMAKQRLNGVVSLYPVVIQIDDGVRPNTLLMPPDIPETDVLTDPGLGKEPLLGFWDFNEFKLPETYFKTVPIDSGTVDYGVSSEYAGENEKSTSLPGSDWLQCASRHTGIPRWLLAFAIVLAALSALWLCLAPEKSTESVEKITLVKPSTPSKVTIYVPDEAPLHKKPPPKYSEVVDMNDHNLQV